MPKSLDITGQIFGSLKALEKAPSRNKKTYWLCECLLCGNKKEIQTSHLTSGVTKTCGCRRITHFGKDKIHNRQCVVCQKDFVPNCPTRLYCYDCSPEGLDNATAIRYRKRALKHFLIQKKGGKCERCGYNKCEGALQFHHIDPTQKEFNFSHVNLSEIGLSLKDFLEELEKCELLCANCHFEEHYIKDD